jgi:predicted Zn-ribbon and HTH transcriptional regulator
MKRLCTTTDQIQAHLISNRLAAQGIAAEVRDTHTAALYGSAFPASIWVLNDADWDQAVAVFDQYRREEQHTQVDRMPVTGSAHCAECGYDLRGHHGEGRCPECGREFRMSRACPACAEAVPDNFDICWNCGAAMDED